MEDGERYVMHTTSPGVPGGVSVSAKPSQSEPGKVELRIAAGPFVRRATADANDANNFARALMVAAAEAVIAGGYKK